MKKYSTLLALFFVLCWIVPSNATVSITLLDYEFIRGSGAPVTESHTFSGKSGPATIKLWNGGAEDGSLVRVSSTEVYVNGELIFGPHNFNQNVSHLEATVILNEVNNNLIECLLKSKPGGTIRVEIVQEINEPFATPLDPDKIIDDEGAIYVLNEILVDLFDDAPEQVALDIASSVGGYVIGYVPSINLIQIKVPVSSKEELQEFIDNINSNLFVENAFRNYVSESHAITNDLENRKVQDEASVEAYKKIEIFRAWEYILEKRQSFNPVKIGIIDNGVDSHEEFIGVNFGDSPKYFYETDTHPEGHGTSVAGIIGANNLSAKQENIPDVQMNGIISGLPDDDSESGSLIDYTLEIRMIQYVDPNKTPDISKKLSGITLAIFAGSIEVLAERKVQVINISQGYEKIKTQEEFDRIYNTFANLIRGYKKVVFVVAAGNQDTYAATVIPASITGENIITVGATDLSDKRASWGLLGLGGKSNYGERIDIAAPGVDVYAPAKYSDPLDENDYTMFRGTSASAPLVTGVVGLLLAINEKLDPAEIKEILRNTGDDISTDKLLGGKRLNAFNAVKYTLGLSNTVTFEFSGHIGGVEDYVFGIKEGDSFSGKVTYDIGEREDEDSDTTIGRYPCPYESCQEPQIPCEDESPTVLNNRIEVIIHGEYGDVSFSTCTGATVRDVYPEWPGRWGDRFSIGGGRDDGEGNWNILSIGFYGLATVIDNDSLPDKLNLSDWGAASLSSEFVTLEYICVVEDVIGECLEYAWIPITHYYFEGQIDELNMLP